MDLSWNPLLSPIRKVTKAQNDSFGDIFNFSQSTDAQARHLVVAQASLNFENEKSHPK